MNIALEDIQHIEEFVKICQEKKDKVDKYSVALNIDEGWKHAVNFLTLEFYSNKDYKFFTYKLQNEDDYEAFINTLKEL